MENTAPVSPHGLQLTTPRPAITCIKEFAEYLRTDIGVDPSLHHLFIDAARNRWAWKNGRLYDHHGLEALVGVFGGSLRAESEYAWVGRRGQIVYVSKYAHDVVAEVFLGKSEVDVEKNWARVTTSINDDDDALYFVKRPTKAMRAGVLTVMANRGQVRA